ncbi:MAG: PPC domain-containing DNA-binding protein [Solirubrobacterales bacterium]
MEYRQGNFGRVLIARVDHGDDLLAGLRDLVTAEKLEAAIVYIIGALRTADIVLGPKECVVPPDPVWHRIEGGYEVVGIGTVYSGDDGPEIHLHASAGRQMTSVTGCIRKEFEAYLVVEMIVIEIVGTGVRRRLDPASGLNLPFFSA